VFSNLDGPERTALAKLLRKLGRGAEAMSAKESVEESK